MFKNISKAGKALLLTLGTGTVGGFAYYTYNTNNTNNQIQIPNVELTEPKIIIENVHTPSGQDAQGISVGVEGEDNHAKVEGKHVHDTDVRVLDMVGFPAVHGSNILEEQAATKEEKEVKKQHKQVSNQNKISTTEQQPSNPVQTSSLAQANSPTQNQQQKQPNPPAQHPQLNQPKPILNIHRIPPKTVLKTIAQIPYLPDPKILKNQTSILILPDPGYTSMFQAQLTNKITKILKTRKSSQPLTIYRIDTRNKAAVQEFQKQFNTKISQQDIYLLRNPYDNGFVNISFDMFLKYDRVPGIYLSDLKCMFQAEELRNGLLKMTPNDTYLLLTIDSKDEPLKIKSKLTAKYIQMQLGVQSYQNVKVCLIDINQAKASGIISSQTKPNTLHLIRKGNQFTFKSPNRYLFGNRPYHVLENISLQDRNHKIIIPKYLSRIETFSSMSLDSPYICVINIDRNKTTPREQRQIMNVLAQIKSKQEFPMVSFVLKFGETEYKGVQEEEFSNKRWCLKLANVNQIDNHFAMHEIRKLEDAKEYGINQKNWLRNTFEYLYKEPEITEEGIRNFFNRVFDGKQPQHFKSETKFKLQHVEKATGENFNQTILNENSHSHLVFQYSNHCQACQALSPLIQYFADVCSRFPNIQTKVHALNCQKNKVKGQPYSPYTPNLYLYSKNWKNKMPIRYPIIEYINHTNIWGIYDFCMITDQLKKIDMNKFEQHVKNITENKIRLTDF